MTTIRDNYLNAAATKATDNSQISTDQAAAQVQAIQDASPSWLSTSWARRA